jgi:surface protein
MWNLKTVDVSHFDTSNVTDLSWMFLEDSSITGLDVSHFNTSNVKTLSNMFA